MNPIKISQEIFSQNIFSKKKKKKKELITIFQIKFTFVLDFVSFLKKRISPSDVHFTKCHIFTMLKDKNVCIYSCTPMCIYIHAQNSSNFHLAYWANEQQTHSELQDLYL